MQGVDFGPESESMLSNQTTESVASIFQANADFLTHVEERGPVKKNKYEQTFDVGKALVSDYNFLISQIDQTSSLLLLDLRDEEEFSLTHIVGAINYPGPNILRDKFHT